MNKEFEKYLNKLFIDINERKNRNITKLNDYKLSLPQVENLNYLIQKDTIILKTIQEVYEKYVDMCIEKGIKSEQEQI